MSIRTIRTRRLDCAAFRVRAGRDRRRRALIPTLIAALAFAVLSAVAGPAGAATVTAAPSTDRHARATPPSASRCR